MKSKVKFAVLVLVIGLLGLAILASPVFGKGKTTYFYDITITIDGKHVTTFMAAGNKDGTRIVGDEEFQQDMVEEVEMNFPEYFVTELDEAEDEAARFNDYPLSRALYWSPLEDNYLNLIPNFTECNKFDGLEAQLQDLNSDDWKYHSGRLDYRKVDCTPPTRHI